MRSDLSAQRSVSDNYLTGLKVGVGFSLRSAAIFDGVTILDGSFALVLAPPVAFVHA